MAKRAQAAKEKFEPLAEIGSTGLAVASGYIADEQLSQLRGLHAAKLWREMSDNDPIIGALLFVIRMLIRQVEWTVEAASDSAEDQANAQFLQECMEDMSVSWSDVIDEVCTMFPYGYAPMEIVYKMRGGPNADDGMRRSRFTDNRIGWRKISLRPQDTVIRWSFDEGGGIRGVYQRAVKVAPGDTTFSREVFIPIEKMLLFRTTAARNNPEGRSILRNAYRPWFFKKKMEEIEAIGIERGIAGLPVMYIPMKCMSDKAAPHEKAIYEQAKQIVTRIRLDQEAGLVLPSDTDERGNRYYELEFKGIDGRRTADTSSVINRHNRDILVSVLADFILLGHERVGSFALSSDKTNLFAVALGGWLNTIEDTFNRFGVPRLFALNAMRTDNLPRLRHGDIEAPDLDELAGYISTLVNAGVPLLPDDRLENHLRAVAKLPLKEDAPQAEPRRGRQAGEPVRRRAREILDDRAGAPDARGNRRRSGRRPTIGTEADADD